ncbi:hypothetical protein [Halocalculus aciditolerans]|uniref:PD(D/E)XK endonuclease domain-containing protein n=1 Tax=Halocalculus aciditolerans TaxID=1383812 RepID=A0A830FH22_9EURY|nr:hypothetical protein [Halocalculus aciditolerans]GGL73688.1 hypothetical protein GCM10009039_34740 [Halocalculus aciditolerans]
MSEAARRSSKHAGEAIEAEVIQRVPSLAPVSDHVAEWHDARVDGLLTPSNDVHFGSICLLENATVVEIKAAQVRLASGQRGRFYIRQRQHERLVQEAASYLFAVYDPQSFDVLAMLVCPASVVDDLLPAGWTEVRGDRAETGYRQLAWSRLFTPELVEGSA